MEWATELEQTNLVLGVIISILLVVLAFYIFKVLRTPGPWGLPLVGYYFFLKKDFHIQLSELAKKHGDVYLINIGGQEYLHLNTAKAIKEALVSQTDNFESRGENLLLQIGFTNGLVVMDGDAWKQHRKFFIQNMKNSGLEANKGQMKGSIEDAVEYTLQSLDKAQSESIDLISLLMKPCKDAVVELFLGCDVSQDDINEINETFIKLIEPMISKNVFLAGNIARYLIFPWIKGHSQVLSCASKMKKLLRKVIASHKSSLDFEQPPRDFIDQYLKEKHDREKKMDPTAKYFTDEVLVGILTQAYGDGSSSIASFVATFLYKIAFYAKAQDNVYEEILRVVGTERLPTMNDKVNLPITNSTLKELMRTSEFFPVSPGMQCIKTTKVLGVGVPKGCITLSNFWSANNDPRIYENPSEFDALRFLNVSEQPIIFGMGKRSCAAESLVMSEVFFYFTSILQNFKLHLVDENISILDKIINFDKFEVFVVPRAGGRFSSSSRSQ